MKDYGTSGVFGGAEEKAEKTNGRVPRYGAPVRLESNTAGLVADIGKIAASNMRVKPTYADCWLIGSADELDIISEYRLPGAGVIIGEKR